MYRCIVHLIILLRFFFFSNLRSIVFASDMVIYGYIFHNFHFLYFIALTIIQLRTNDEEIKIMTIFTLCILFYLDLLILLFFLIFFYFILYKNIYNI